MVEVWLREKSTLEQNEDGLLIMWLRTDTGTEGNLQPEAMARKETRESERERETEPERERERKAARKGKFRMEICQDAQIPGLTLASLIKRQGNLCTSCDTLPAGVQES